MPSNVEIKARVEDTEKLKLKAKELSGTEPVCISQTDTFFNVPNCRLKLRELKNKPSELIYYSRPDQSGPKCSEYHISYVENPEEIKTTLTKALGRKGEVKKDRLLYIVGQTRIHVDAVQGLGDYMELEVVMEDGQTLDEGQQIAEDIMNSLGIEKTSLVEGAYMDLIAQRQQQNGN